MSLGYGHALDPQLHLLLEMNDFETLSLDPEGLYFLCFFFPYFTCVEKENCSLSLEETEGPVSWVITWSFPAWTIHHTAVKENNFSWASWRVPEQVWQALSLPIFSSMLVFLGVTPAWFYAPLQRSPVALQGLQLNPIAVDPTSVVEAVPAQQPHGSLCL